MSTRDPFNTQTPSTGSETAESANPTSASSIARSTPPANTSTTEAKNEAEGRETKEEADRQASHAAPSTMASSHSSTSATLSTPSGGSGASHSLSSTAGALSLSLSSSSAGDSFAPLPAGGSGGTGDRESSSASALVDDTNPDTSGRAEPSGAKLSHGLLELLSEVSDPSLKSSAQVEIKSAAKKSEVNDNKKPYENKYNLDREFHGWESHLLPQAIRDYTLAILGKPAAATMAPVSTANQKRIDDSAVVQERIRLQAALALTLTQQQRDYLQSRRVQQKIKDKLLTVNQAIFETRPSVVETLKYNKARFEAIKLGCSPRETSGLTWSPEHLSALQEDIPYETIAKLDTYQVQGLRLGLTAEQIKIREGLSQKLTLLEKERKRIELENKERDDKIKSERAEEDKKAAEAKTAKTARRTEEDKEREEKIASEIASVKAEGMEGLGEIQIDPEATGAKIRERGEKQKKDVIEARASEDEIEQKRLDEITERRKAEDNKCKAEITQKLRVYFDSLGGLGVEQLQGLDNSFTVDEVRAPWYSRPAIEALKLDIGKSQLKTLKHKLTPEHIDALRDGYSFPEIKDLMTYQINAMRKCNLDPKDALKIGPEYVSLQLHFSDLLPTLIEKRGVAILDDIKGLSKNVQLEGLLEGLTRKELDEIERFGATQNPRFEFTQDHMAALQHKWEFKDIRDKKPHQLRLMTKFGLLPEQALQIQEFQVAVLAHPQPTARLRFDQALKVTSPPQADVFYQSLPSFKEKGVNIDEVLDANLQGDQLQALTKGCDLKTAREIQGFHNRLLYHPTAPLKPEQAVKVTSQYQADNLYHLLPSWKEKGVNIDEVLDANLNWSQLQAVNKGFQVKDIRGLQEFQLNLFLNNPNNFDLQKGQAILSLKQVQQITSQKQADAIIQVLPQLKEKGPEQIDEMIAVNLDHRQMQAFIKWGDAKTCRELQEFQLGLVLNPTMPFNLEQARKVTSQEQANAIIHCLTPLKEKGPEQIDAMIAANLNIRQMQAFIKWGDAKTCRELQEFQLDLVLNPTMPLKPEQARKVSSPQQALVLRGFLAHPHAKLIDINEVLNQNLKDFQFNLLLDINNFDLEKRGQAILSLKQVQQITSQEQAGVISSFLPPLKEKSPEQIDEIIAANLNYPQMQAFIKWGDAKTCRELQEFQLNLLNSPNNFDAQKKQAILSLKQVQQITSQEQGNAIIQVLPQLKEKSPEQIDEIIAAKLDQRQMQVFIKCGDAKSCRELQEFQANFLLGHSTPGLTPRQAMKLSSDQSTFIGTFLPKLMARRIDIDEVIEARLNWQETELVTLGVPIPDAKNPKYLSHHFVESLRRGTDFKEIAELKEYQVKLQFSHGDKLTRPQLLQIRNPKQAELIWTFLFEQREHDIETLLRLSDLQLEAVVEGYPAEEVVKLEDWCLRVLISSEGELPIEQVTQPWFTPLHGLCLGMQIKYSEIEGKPPEALMEHLGTMTPFKRESSPAFPPAQPLLFSASSSLSSPSTASAKPAPSVTGESVSRAPEGYEYVFHM